MIHFKQWFILSTLRLVTLLEINFTICLKKKKIIITFNRKTKYLYVNKLGLFLGVSHDKIIWPPLERYYRTKRFNDRDKIHRYGVI